MSQIKYHYYSYSYNWILQQLVQSCSYTSVTFLHTYECVLYNFQYYTSLLVLGGTNNTYPIGWHERFLSTLNSFILILCKRYFKMYQCSVANLLSAKILFIALAATQLYMYCTCSIATVYACMHVHIRMYVCVCMYACVYACVCN